MATYVIGDLHGCFDELLDLLKIINFHEDRDHIFFAGDLVNGAAKSLECLEYVKYLSSLAGNGCVIGNHDIALLACGLGLALPPRDRKHGVEKILESSNLPHYLEWLMQLPLCIDLPQFNYFLVHAGVYPLWDVSTCLQLSDEVLRIFNSAQRDAFLATIHGNTPDVWDNELVGFERARFVTNAFTRMRLLSPGYKLNFTHKRHFNLVADKELKPWFELIDFNTFKRTVVFGHWASIDNYANLPHAICVDHGCVWGRTLAALRLDDHQVFSVQAKT